ncbi:hypothetical protein ACL02U_11910 [Streptomyces sp. MS06]|uniref:hypothetical protein n=1 Tax=Streptomyces sp. MS06 TaxID=3385974 RepID=UPI0039A1005C
MAAPRRRLNDKHRDTFATHASPAAIEAALRAELAEAHRVNRRIAWLEELLTRRSQEIENAAARSAAGAAAADTHTTH